MKCHQGQALAGMQILGFFLLRGWYRFRSPSKLEQPSENKGKWILASFTAKNQSLYRVIHDSPMPTLVPPKPYLHSSVLLEIYHASSLRLSLGLFFDFFKFQFFDWVFDCWNPGLRRYFSHHANFGTSEIILRFIRSACNLKTVLGIVVKKMPGRFQAEWMNGSMVYDLPKFPWVSKILFKQQKISKKTVLGIVAKKMHGKFQAEFSDVPKLAWVGKISSKP